MRFHLEDFVEVLARAATRAATGEITTDLLAHTRRRWFPASALLQGAISDAF